MASRDLMVRLQGEIFSWADAAPVVLGWAAFGAAWPHLLPPPTSATAPRWVPPADATPQPSVKVRRLGSNQVRGVLLLLA